MKEGEERNAARRNASTLEWMWADAGTELTRKIAQQNPLRWTKGSTVKVYNDLHKHTAKRRPVSIRVVGTETIYDFANPGEAMQWVEQRHSSTSEPETEYNFKLLLFLIWDSGGVSVFRSATARAVN